MAVDHARAASRALSDLNMLGAIKVLVQSSLMRDCKTFERKVSSMCDANMQRMLSKYDYHLALCTPPKDNPNE